MIEGGLIEPRRQWRTGYARLRLGLSCRSWKARENHSATQTHQPLAAGEDDAWPSFVFVFRLVHMKILCNRGLPSSQFPFAALVGNIVACTSGNCHDSQCGLIAALCHEHCAVGNENVFHVVELAEAVDD